MDQVSSHQQAEFPMPINSSYVGGLHGHGHAQDYHHHHHHVTMTHHIHPHNHHHNPIIPSSSPSPSPSSQMPLSNTNGTITTNNIHKEENHHDGKKKMVMIKYKECQKNHAALMGGNARDGCGEFMASGEEGSLEALTCSACTCHRNFHRKEVEGDEQQHMIIPHGTLPFYPSTPHANLIGTRRGKKVILGGGVNVVPFSRSVPISRAYQIGGQSSDDHDDDHDHHQHHYGGVMVMRPHLNNQMVKKRFRTKFSPEQKEKMLEFAEKVGWKIQRQEESVVQQFCQEIGVKRRVLKVWMHNNRHLLSKKTNITSDNHNNNSSSNI